MSTEGIAEIKAELFRLKQEKSMVWKFKKIYYRLFQMVLKFIAALLPFPVPFLLTGHIHGGSVSQNSSHSG
jgi:hypothetical protein